VAEGRPADAVRPSIFAFTACHEDSATALAMASARLGTQYAQDFSRIAAKYTITGTPAECRARIREYVDAGAEVVFLSSACPADYADRNEELIAKEVLSAFK
jgi:alkanesulfonate monooxygenase SsuD/methylene tetrahydromethanopterin reductase-like flavin-dependent oxidoreductase (luciferase family)